MSAVSSPVSNWARCSVRTVRKYPAMSFSSSRSSPLSRSVPCRMATIDSVGACDVPPAMEEMAVSTMSAPASADLSSVAMAKPLVLCVCTCTGRPTRSLIAFTRS